MVVGFDQSPQGRDPVVAHAFPTQNYRNIQQPVIRHEDFSSLLAALRFQGHIKIPEVRNPREYEFKTGDLLISPAAVIRPNYQN